MPMPNNDQVGAEPVVSTADASQDEASRGDMLQDPHALFVASEKDHEAAHVADEVNPIDPVVEKAILRKLDRRVVPLLFLMYLMAFLDRSNIGNAAIAGMKEDLSLDSQQFQWLLTIFYIPYIVFEWMTVMWKIVPPHRWAAATVAAWGIASTCQAAAVNWQAMMVCRFFLATAEAAFGPGVPYLLSFFYRRREVGFRCGLFVSAAPLATTFAGALATGITSSKNPSLANWRVLFLAEGLPCLPLALAAWYLLPDAPEKARFLSVEERRVARDRAILQSGQTGTERHGRMEWRASWGALKSPATWIPPLMFFGSNVSYASLPVFLPKILTEMGYTRLQSQGLTAPPFLLSFLVCIGTTWLSDRLGQRGYMIALLSAIGAVGYYVLATVHNNGVRYFAVFLAAGGVFPAIANILPWVNNNQGTDSKRAIAFAILNLIGQCGPLLGTRSFPEHEGPYYHKGMFICAAFMTFNLVLALGLRFHLARENARLDMGEGQGEKRPEEANAPEYEGTPSWRYIL